MRFRIRLRFHAWLAPWHSKILDEKSGLCSRERGDKTRASIDEVSDKLHDLSLKAECPV